jgi:hypothetical protein
MVCFVAKKLSLSKRVLSVNSVNSPKPLFSHVTQRTLLRQIIPPKLILSVSCTKKKFPHAGVWKIQASITQLEPMQHVLRKIWILQVFGIAHSITQLDIMRQKHPHQQSFDRNWIQYCTVITQLSTKC